MLSKWTYFPTITTRLHNDDRDIFRGNSLLDTFGSLFSNTNFNAIKYGNLKEFFNNEGYKVIFAVPGISAKDIEISFKGNTLTVSGIAKEEACFSEDFIFSRYFDDSYNVDEASSSLKNGELTVFVPLKSTSEEKEVERKLNITVEE